MNFFWIFSPLRKLGKDIFTALETWQRMHHGPVPARFAPRLVAGASGTRRIARRNPRPTRARALDPGRRDDSEELEGAYRAELFLFDVKLGTRHRGRRLRPRQPPSAAHLSGTALCLIHIETWARSRPDHLDHHAATLLSVAISPKSVWRPPAAWGRRFTHRYEGFHAAVPTSVFAAADFKDGNTQQNPFDRAPDLSGGEGAAWGQSDRLS
jgi:hypothetical protein